MGFQNPIMGKGVILVLSILISSSLSYGIDNQYRVKRHIYPNYESSMEEYEDSDNNLEEMPENMKHDSEMTQISDKATSRTFGKKFEKLMELKKEYLRTLFEDTDKDYKSENSDETDSDIFDKPDYKETDLEMTKKSEKPTSRKLGKKLKKLKKLKKKLLKKLFSDSEDNKCSKDKPDSFLNLPSRIRSNINGGDYEEISRDMSGNFFPRPMPISTGGIYRPDGTSFRDGPITLVGRPIGKKMVTLDQ